eukprot:TRINITY_DN2793_c0_g1_i1.p1 TRINITY_DN2793_c0_g1~~TRINITY_DN2793_c0_g1_i1.p1  ORF type:complete len:338 (+),score=74.94 TRINITY_DN2793_c0_g1_i1:136-1149(+)
MAWQYNLPIDLVLVRHGESEGNLYKLMQDGGAKERLHSRHNSDFRLTDLGRVQAARAGKVIREKIGRFDRMYCSEYVRAIETAGRMDLPESQFHTEFLIRELDSGIQYGVRHPLKQFSDATRPLAKWWVRKASGGGESMADLCGRLKVFLRQLCDTSSGMRVLVVCHGLVIRAFKALLEGVPNSAGYDTLLDEKIPNCLIKWYTRRDGNGEISSRPLSMTQFALKNPDNIECTDAETDDVTVSIEYKALTAQELVRRAELTPQLINNADINAEYEVYRQQPSAHSQFEELSSETEVSPVGGELQEAAHLCDAVDIETFKAEGYRQARQIQGEQRSVY